MSEVLQALLGNGPQPPMSPGIPGNTGPQQPSPLQEYSKTTAQARGAENMQDKVGDIQAAMMKANQEYTDWLQKNVMAKLPSAQTTMEADMARYRATMAPKEYSGMDNMMTALASMSNTPALGDMGNFGFALGQAGMNAQAMKKAFEQNEQAKAKAVLDEQQQMTKMYSDEAKSGMAQLGKLAAASQGKWIPSPKEPGVWVNNATGERRVISDAEHLQLMETARSIMATGKYDNMQDAYAAAVAVQAERPSRVGMAPGAANQGQTQPAAGATAPAEVKGAGVSPAQNALPATNAPFGMEFDGSKLTQEQNDNIARMMARYTANPNEGTKSAVLNYLASLGITPKAVPPGGTPEKPAYPATAKEKAETASQAGFTITPEIARDQGLPYTKSIYEKYTDPKRREDAIEKYAKEWNDWQEKNMPKFTALQSDTEKLDRFLELQRTNKGTDAGPMDKLPFVTDIRASVNPALQEMRAISKELALAKHVSGTGAMSDKDMEVFQNAVVGIDKSAKTNENMAAMAKAAFARAEEFQRFASKMYKTYAHIDPMELKSMWRDYTKANPIYGETTEDGSAVILKPVPFEQYFQTSPKYHGKK